MNALHRYQLMMGGIDALKDSLVTESSLRRSRSVEEWSNAEAIAIWKAARDYAQQHGLCVPLLDDVVRVERQARGHCDYASKWALYIVELMVAERAATGESTWVTTPASSSHQS
jgi:hypothetical protein